MVTKKAPQNRIAELRKSRNITLQQIATRLRVGANTISRYENSKRDPKPDTWKELADYFNVPVSYLQGYGWSVRKVYDFLFISYIDGILKNNYGISIGKTSAVSVNYYEIDGMVYKYGYKFNAFDQNVSLRSRVMLDKAGKYSFGLDLSSTARPETVDDLKNDHNLELFDKMNIAAISASGKDSEFFSYVKGKLANLKIYVPDKIEKLIPSLNNIVKKHIRNLGWSRVIPVNGQFAKELAVLSGYLQSTFYDQLPVLTDYDFMATIGNKLDEYGITGEYQIAEELLKEVAYKEISTRKDKDPSLENKANTLIKALKVAKYGRIDEFLNLTSDLTSDDLEKLIHYMQVLKAKRDKER